MSRRRPLDPLEHARVHWRGPFLAIDRVPVAEARVFRDRWRRAFGVPRPVPHRLSWESFHDGPAPFVEGAAARAAWTALWEPRERYVTGRRLIVLPHEDDTLAFHARAATPPVFPPGCEIYVTTHAFDWTMAFTHEDGWIGPYFVRAPA